MAGDMALDVPELLLPASAVRLVSEALACRGEGLEAGLGHGEERSSRRILQTELDQRRGLCRVVHLGIDGRRVPAEAEEALGLHALDPGGHGQVLVAGIGDLSADLLPGLELATEGDPEPLGELARVGEGAPDAGARRPEDDLLLDAVRDGLGHVQPPDCTYSDASPE